MRDAEPTLKRLVDYRPPSHRVPATELHFTINEGSTRVVNRMNLEVVDGSVQSCRFDGDELELVSVSVDGVTLNTNEYSLDASGLTLHDLPASCAVEVVTQIDPDGNTQLEGLYRSGGMFCTQCEAEGFRRITFFPDRPDVLSVFTTTINADAARYPVLIANGNPIAERTLPGGRAEVTWHDPFPKPCYLFALVAGDLEQIDDRFVTASGRVVTLKIFSEAHNIGQCGYAMDALKRSMRWDEQRYGREYDLDIFMIVAVEDFNGGAMENKGLNLFNTACVLASPDTATDAAYQRVEGVIGHEYFHNWSGNRVTCRDWFQLSLKEGFTVFRDAQFSGDMGIQSRKRIDDVEFLRSIQFAEDAGPLAHPVRPDTYMEISNFYTTTVYEKGAEVVRMIHTLIGDDAFRRGSDLYFSRHDGDAVTTDDFVVAMEDATGFDLTQFRLWYSQAGTPRVRVDEAFGDNGLTLKIEQRLETVVEQPSVEPMHIPVLVGFVATDGTQVSVSHADVDADVATEVRDGGASLLIHVTQPRQQVRVALAERPVVSYGRGFSAPVHMETPHSATDLALLVAEDTDGFVRWDSAQRLAAGIIDRGGAADAVYLAMIGSLLEEAESLCVQISRVGVDALQDDSSIRERLGILDALLTLPSESTLIETHEQPDVAGLCQARDRLTLDVARAHSHRWHGLVEAIPEVSSYRPRPLDMAIRALKWCAVRHVVWTLEGGEGVSLLAPRYDAADNLTDRLGALELMLNAPAAGAVDDERVARISNDFRAAWEQEALVLNQWFRLHATARDADATHVSSLLEDPQFDWRNPNRVYAVLLSFATRNHRNFHCAEGYRLVTNSVLRLDRANPQLASRVVTPLTQWRKFAESTGDTMRSELERLSNASLSNDVFEKVAKALGEDG